MPDELPQIPTMPAEFAAANPETHWREVHANRAAKKAAEERAAQATAALDALRAEHAALTPRLAEVETWQKKASALETDLTLARAGITDPHIGGAILHRYSAIAAEAGDKAPPLAAWVTDGAKADPVAKLLLAPPAAPATAIATPAAPQPTSAAPILPAPAPGPTTAPGVMTPDQIVAAIRANGGMAPPAVIEAIKKQGLSY